MTWTFTVEDNGTHPNYFSESNTQSIHIEFSSTALFYLDLFLTSIQVSSPFKKDNWQWYTMMVHESYLPSYKINQNLWIFPLSFDALLPQRSLWLGRNSSLLNKLAWINEDRKQYIISIRKWFKTKHVYVYACYNGAELSSFFTVFLEDLFISMDGVWLPQLHGCFQHHHHHQHQPQQRQRHSYETAAIKQQ